MRALKSPARSIVALRVWTAAMSSSNMSKGSFATGWRLNVDDSGLRCATHMYRSFVRPIALRTFTQMQLPSDADFHKETNAARCCFT